MNYEFTIEVLRGCKRCSQRPNFSSFGSLGSGMSTYAVVCCSSISGKTLEDAMWKWNNFNIEASTSFRYDRDKRLWKIYKPV